MQKKGHSYIAQFFLLFSLLFPSLSWGADAWTFAFQIGNSATTLPAQQVAMNSAGHSIAIWVANGALYKSVSNFNGGWSSQIQIASNVTSASSSNLSVTINDSDDIIFAWIGSGSVLTATSTFNDTSTTFPTTKNHGTGSQPALSLNNNGNAILAWNAGGSIKTKTSSKTSTTSSPGAANSWSSSHTAAGTGVLPSVKINNSNQFALGWTTGNQARISSALTLGSATSTTWSSNTVTLGTTTILNSRTVVNINDSGTILAAWIANGAGDIRTVTRSARSTSNASSQTISTAIDNGISISSFQVGMIGADKAAIVWATTTNGTAVRTATLGSTWEIPLTLLTDASTIQFTNTKFAINSGGGVVATFRRTSSGTTTLFSSYRLL